MLHHLIHALLFIATNVTLYPFYITLAINTIDEYVALVMKCIKKPAKKLGLYHTYIIIFHMVHTRHISNYVLTTRQNI